MNQQDKKFIDASIDPDPSTLKTIVLADDPNAVQAEPEQQVSGPEPDPVTIKETPILFEEP